ncbi:MAG: hypothetical protein ACREPX_14455 [Rhodanobacteraceae bacterium]
MLRWIMLALIVLGIAVTFTTKSVGLLSLGILMGVVGFFGMVFSLAADRVSASARPESSMAGPEDLAAMRTRRPIAAVKSVPPPAAPRPVAEPRQERLH